MEQKGKHVPILALTAGNIKEERDKCFESGMDDFIAKPIIEATISDALHKWLRLAK